MNNKNFDDEKPEGGETLPIGEKTTKKGQYKIDDITNNAIVLLRNSINPEIALMNLGVTDSINARELISDLVKEYVDRYIPPDNEYPKNIQAFVIGGDYREHKMTDDGRIIYVDHKLARVKALEALNDLELKVTPVPTDKRSVKTVLIDQNGSFEIRETRKGLNIEEAEMSKAEYERGLDDLL